MSFNLLKTAKHIRGLSNAEFRVLYFLLDSANDNTCECFPSMKVIAEYTDMAERTVQRHVSNLAERGIFSRVAQYRSDGSRTSNLYIFNVSGTLTIGKEPAIDVGLGHGPYAKTEEGKDPAPERAAATARTSTTPRQHWRDINQESEPVIEPGISPSSPLPPNGESDSLFEDLPEADRAASPSEIGIVLFEQWNRMAATQSNVRAIRSGAMHSARLEAARRIFCTSTLQSLAGDVEVLISKISASSFLTGNNERNWACNLDWILKRSNYEKVMEGSYDDREASAARTSAGSSRGSTRGGSAISSTRLALDLLRKQRESGNLSSDERTRP